MLAEPVPPSEETLAVSPFDDEDADVIVKSCDKHEFRLYKVILAKASQIFRDAFSLPQNPSASIGLDPPEVIDGLPVIYLEEDSRTLALLFRLCYPVEPPELASLDDVYPVLAAATKYAMDGIVTISRKAWPTVAAKEPLRAFAIACRMHWTEEARIAARCTLREPVWPLEPPLDPEFKAVSAETIVRLISYHRKCAAAAVRCLQNTEWSTRIFEQAVCLHCLGQSTLGSAQNLRLRDWYSKYIQQAKSVLVVQPAGCTLRRPAFFTTSVHSVFGSPPCEAPAHCLSKIDEVISLFAEEIESHIAQVRTSLPAIDAS